MAYHPEIKEQLDPRLLPWPGVTSRKMFGAICYLYQDRMFAFITGDSVVTKLPPEERERALEHYGASQFIVSGGRPFGEWVQFCVPAHSKVGDLIGWIEASIAYVKSSALRRRVRGGKRTAGKA